MNNRDPNIEAIELVAKELGPVRDEVVLVGGCAVGLLITDPATPANRETRDVDLVAEVISLPQYYSLTYRIKQQGFVEGDAHICRWVKGELVIDVMPTSNVTGGSTNSWYKFAMADHSTVMLRDGTTIRVVSAPVFIATKLEAFANRGNGDFTHHDIEDVVNVVDGRPELQDELMRSANEVRDYVRDEFEELITNGEFTDKLPWHVPGDEGGQARIPIILGRMRKIAGL